MPPLLPAPLPTFTHHIVLFSYTPHALHDPSHSPAPTSLSSPIFAFLTHLWALFLCTFTLYSMYIHTYMFTSAECIYIDRFFLDAASYQGRRDEYLNSVGKRPPKSVQILRYAPYWMLEISYIADTQWEGLVVPNCNPQLSASWGCTATSSDQVQRKPNQWSGGNR
jgi:hypothetical protein